MNGTVAEGMTMSVQERKQLAEAWSQAAKKNNQHLIIQVGGTRLADVKDLVCKTFKLLKTKKKKRKKIYQLLGQTCSIRQRRCNFVLTRDLL